MSVVAGTPTIIINNFNVFEALVPLTLSGSYPGTANGDPLDLSGIVASNSVPLLVEIFEQPPAGTLASGIAWRYAVGTDQTNGALQAFAGSSLTMNSYTPAGTNAKPTFTVKNGTILANGTIGLTADTAGADVVGGTGITADRTLTTTSPVGIPAFSGTPAILTGSNSVPANLGNVTYASVNAGHLVARCVFRKFE